METNIVTIDLGARSYDIYIGSGLLQKFSDFVPMDVSGLNAYIVTDTNVQTYAEQVKAQLLGAGAGRVEVLTLQPGEQTKSFANVEKIIDWMLDHDITRDSVVIAVGGGVIGDITGFCASSVMRGVPYIQVPTTLLAQVDSSVGGKTGINTKRGKNLIGSFYQPIAVVADIDTLKTLAKRELLAGYAEVVKYGPIRDPAFFDWLVKNGKDVCALDKTDMAYAIETSCEAKAVLVQADEQEKGRRALLNLGHTFGHALEAAAGYDGRLLHGEAVSIGMVMAFDLSVRMGRCEREDFERVERHLSGLGLLTRASQITPPLNVSAQSLLESMRRDKKVEKGKIRYIVVNKIGDAFIEDDVPENLVRAVLTDSLGEANAPPRKSVAKSFGSTGVRGLWRSVFSSHS